jgi:hypothetical protein
MVPGGLAGEGPGSLEGSGGVGESSWEGGEQVGERRRLARLLEAVRAQMREVEEGGARGGGAVGGGGGRCNTRAEREVAVLREMFAPAAESVSVGGEGRGAEWVEGKGKQGGDRRRREGRRSQSMFVSCILCVCVRARACLCVCVNMYLYFFV